MAYFGVFFVSRFRHRFGSRFRTLLEPLWKPSWGQKTTQNVVGLLKISISAFTPGGSFWQRSRGRFEAVFDLQIDPKAHQNRLPKRLRKRDPKTTPPRAQNDPQDAPGPPPKWPQDVPKTPREAPGGPQGAPQTRQDAPRRPKTPRDSPGTPPGPPRDLQNGRFGLGLRSIWPRFRSVFGLIADLGPSSGSSGAVSETSAEARNEKTGVQRVTRPGGMREAIE